MTGLLASTTTDFTYEREREFKKEVTEILKSVIPKANVETWAGHVGESWRELMKGWADLLSLRRLLLR